MIKPLDLILVVSLLLYVMIYPYPRKPFKLGKSIYPTIDTELPAPIALKPVITHDLEVVFVVCTKQPTYPV